MATVGGRQQYYIIGAETIDELVQEVNDAIADGYAPCGGIAPCVYVDPDVVAEYRVVINYYQAMIDMRIKLKIW